MIKKLHLLVGLGCVSISAIQASPFDSLITAGANGTSAGTITFIGWQTGDNINYVHVNYYTGAGCNSSNFIGGGGGSFTTTTFSNRQYNINGVELYSLASNSTYTHFNSGSASSVGSFLFLYSDQGMPASGMSDVNGSTSLCPCFNVSVTGGNAYQGSSTATGITYLTNATCST